MKRLTAVELPKWKRLQQLACIGIQPRTSLTRHLKRLEKGLKIYYLFFFILTKKKKLCIREPLLLQQLFTPNTSVFRFTTVAKILLGINNQLLKQQDWNQFNLHAKFVLSLFKKLVTK